MDTVYVSVEKEELKRLDSATSASSLSDFTHSGSHGSSDDHDLPSNTSSWSLNLIDKFGIRKVLTDPFELVRYEWSLCNLTDDEVFRIDEIVKICSLPCIDFHSLEEIPFEKSKLYKQWVQEWFPKTTVKELKLFSDNCEEFGYFLFDTIQQIHKPKKRENEEPFEIDYQVLFEKFLKLFELKIKVQPSLPTARATIFGQEIASKADLLCTKCDDPRKILSVCEVKRKCLAADSEFSPVKKKLRSSSSKLATVSEEECPNSSFVLGMPPNVYAQHVGKLLAYLESSVLKQGLMGIVVQKTNVIFTFLKVKPESLEKIKRRQKPGSLKFDPSRNEEPLFFYTEQFNFLKSQDRKVIFKALLALRMMEVKGWDY